MLESRWYGCTLRRYRRAAPVLRNLRLCSGAGQRAIHGPLAGRHFLAMLPAALRKPGACHPWQARSAGGRFTGSSALLRLAPVLCPLRARACVRRGSYASRLRRCRRRRRDVLAGGDFPRFRFPAPRRKPGVCPPWRRARRAEDSPDLPHCPASPCRRPFGPRGFAFGRCGSRLAPGPGREPTRSARELRKSPSAHTGTLEEGRRPLDDALLGELLHALLTEAQKPAVDLLIMFAEAGTQPL